MIFKDFPSFSCLIQLSFDIINEFIVNEKQQNKYPFYVFLLMKNNEFVTISNVTGTNLAFH